MPFSCTDVSDDVRIKFHHKRQIYKFHKQRSNSRLARVAPVVKVLTVPVGFPWKQDATKYKLL